MRLSDRSLQSALPSADELASSGPMLVIRGPTGRSWAGSTLVEPLLRCNRPTFWFPESGRRLVWDGPGAGSQPIPQDVLAACRTSRPDLTSLRGTWSLVLFEADGRVLAAQDPFGGRSLFWTSTKETIWVSSDPDLLAVLPDADHSWNVETLVAWLSVYGEPRPGATFLRGLSAIPAGRLVQIAPSQEIGPRFWHPDATPIRRRSEHDWEEQMRSIFKVAVEAASRGLEEPAVLLSSGLDSSMVAAQLAQGRPRGSIGAISWSLPTIPASDETAWIEASVENLGLRWVAVDGSHLWPLHDPEIFVPGPSSPLVSPFRSLRRAVLRAASDEGWTSLLTGDDGDHLYGSTALWLRDRLLDQGFDIDLARRVLLELRTKGLRSGSRWLARNLLPQSFVRMARGRATPPWSWLTRDAIEILRSLPESPRQPGGDTRLARPTNAWFDMIQAALRTEHDHEGIELRSPFRDQALFELSARMPSHLLYQPGETKRIARRAFEGLLPAEIRTAPRRGGLLPFFNLLARHPSRMHDLLDHPDAEWPRWVRRDWMEGALRRFRECPVDGPELDLVWRCLSLELWRQGRG